MEEQRVLKSILIISAVALILKLVIFISPGWAIIGIHFPKHEEETFLEIEDTDQSLALPFIGRPVKEGRQLSVTLGLWFFVVCRHEPYRLESQHAHDDFDGCYHSSYADIKESTKRLPKHDIIIRSTYEKVGYLSKVGLLEYQIEATVGLIFVICGIIGTILYMHFITRRRSYGLLACISFLISGTLYLVAVGKVCSNLIHVREMINMFYGGKVYGVHVPAPWCLVLGGIASVMTLFVALIHMLNISRNRVKRADSGIYYTSFDDDKDVAIKTKPSFLPDTTYFPPFDSNVSSGPILEKGSGVRK